MLNQNIDLSLRQVDIKNKMVEAKNCSQFKVLDHLSTKWVHRFGLESLPVDIYGTQQFNAKDTTPLAINDLKDVSTLQNRTCIDQTISKGPIKSFELTNDNDIKENSKELPPTEKYLEDIADKPMNTYSSPPPRILNRFRKWLPTEIPRAS